MQDIKDVFSYLDPSKQGLIDLKDLGTAFRCLGLNPTECEVQDLAEESINTNSKITQDELLRLYNKCKLNCVTNKEEVLKFFKSLEKNGDGLVDAKELKITLCNAGEALLDKEVHSVYAELGISEEGKFNYLEFVEKLFKPNNQH